MFFGGHKLIDMRKLYDYSVSKFRKCGQPQNIYKCKATILKIIRYIFIA